MQDTTDRKDPRTPRARALRRASTPEEKRVWGQLKLLEIKGHFRRQVPIGPYYADFAHLGAKLIVEIDGGQHNAPAGEARDAKRTAWLEQQGFEVIRFWNSDVRFSFESVMDTIFARLDARFAAIAPPTLDPSPPQVGGGKALGSEAMETEDAFKDVST